MANTFQVLTFVTSEMLRQVKNNLQFIRNCSGEDLAGRFTEAPKKGETIKVRKPTRYIGRDGETYSAEDYTERTVDMVVQTTAGVDITLTNRELMFQLDQIAERVVKPAAITLANKIDTAALLQAVNATYHCVGTPATVPNALLTYNQARAKMSWMSTPQDGDHALLINPDMQVTIVDALKGLFQSSSEIQKGYERGVMGVAAGAKWYECQNLPVNTTGLKGGTPLSNGATQSGASIITDGWTASQAILKKGNVITFAGCNAVNPWTRTSIGALQQFTVTADVSSDGTGNATIAVSPAATATGPFQNVSNTIADNSAIVVLGAASVASPQGLRFHRDAFLFASFEQPQPQGAVEFSRSVTDPDTGITIRFIRDWDTVNNKQLNRFDCVWAFGIAFPEFACRIAS